MSDWRETRLGQAAIEEMRDACVKLIAAETGDEIVAAVEHMLGVAHLLVEVQKFEDAIQRKP